MSLYLLAGSFAALVVWLSAAAYFASRSETTEAVVRLPTRLRKLRDRPVIALSLLR